MTDDPTDPLAHQLNGYILLVNLFRPFDDVFITLWNKTRAESSSSYLRALQKQFSDMIPPYMNVQDSDLRANQQWLKTITWHLGLQTPGESLTYQYPIDATRDLASMTSQFPTQHTELLGTPLVAKVLDISSALIDVLSILPPSGDPFSMGPREQLNPLLQLLSVLRSGDHHYLPLLLNKMHDVLPRLANPMLQRAPENAIMQNIDIFDGFGNAGMAQPPMMDFKTEPYTPSSMQHIQDIGTDSGHSNNGDEMKSPFPVVSSPPIMSPGVEYHETSFNSIPDMISPMGQTPQHALSQQGPLNPQQPHHQHQHQHHNLSSHGMNQNHNPMQTDMHANLGHGLNQQNSFANMGQQNMSQNPQFNIMNNMLHRQPPQRTNSFMMHQQHQHQPSQIPRTVGDFHALQRANSENVSMGSLGLSHMNAEVDFSGLR